MPRLALASEEQVIAIYRESRALWGPGLSPEAYRQLWDVIRGTSWAGKHVRFHVWEDDHGRVLSSLKRYRPRTRILGHTGRSSVISAVFTPRARRRRGHAAALVRAVLEQARVDGDQAALLFSDIGTDYYRDLGFLPLPAVEQWGRLPTSSEIEADGWELRAAGAGDHELIRRAHEASSRQRTIAVIRDDEHWQFLRIRAESYFDRVRDRRIRQRTQLVSRRGQDVGYLLAVEGRGQWNVREVGALDGDPQTMAEVLQAGAAGARRAGLRRLYGWLPREVAARLPDWPLRSAPRRRAVPMLLPLDRAIDPEAVRSADRCYIPFHDQF